MSLLAAAALAGALMGQQPSGNPSCVDRVDFQRLRREVARADPAIAVRALYRYNADPAHEDPAGCTAADLERLLGEQERKLVAFAYGGKLSFPQIAAHCFRFDPKTTSCEDIVQDGTGQPDYRHILSRGPGAAFTGRLKNLLPDARLVGLYRTTLKAVQDGRPATALGAKPDVQIARGGAVLIAIFTAPGPPWQYRKFVWYF